MEKKIFTFNQYQALKAINESIDEIIDQVDIENASQIQDLVNQHEEIYKKYDLSSDEIDNIRNSVEDSIRVKLGFNQDTGE